jgi:hypothetical protein
MPDAPELPPLYHLVRPPADLAATVVARKE